MACYCPLSQLYGTKELADHVHNHGSVLDIELIRCQCPSPPLMAELALMIPNNAHKGIHWHSKLATALTQVNSQQRLSSALHTVLNMWVETDNFRPIFSASDMPSPILEAMPRRFKGLVYETCSAAAYNAKSPLNKIWKRLYSSYYEDSIDNNSQGQSSPYCFDTIPFYEDVEQEILYFLEGNTKSPLVVPEKDHLGCIPARISSTAGTKPSCLDPNCGLCSCMMIESRDELTDGLSYAYERSIFSWTEVQHVARFILSLNSILRLSDLGWTPRGKRMPGYPANTLNTGVRQATYSGLGWIQIGYGFLNFLFAIHMPGQRRTEHPGYSDIPIRFLPGLDHPWLAQWYKEEVTKTLPFDGMVLDHILSSQDSMDRQGRHGRERRAHICKWLEEVEAEMED